MSTVIEVRPLDPDGRLFFLGKWRKVLRPGNDSRNNDEVPGLDMTLHEQSGIISIDAPGDSMSLHLSAVAVRHPPAIDAEDWQKERAKAERERQEAREAEEPTPPPRAARSKPVTAAELGFDPNGDDLDDDEVARLLQGPKAKKSLAKKAKKKPAAKKKAPAAPPPVYDDETDDDEGDIDA